MSTPNCCFRKWREGDIFFQLEVQFDMADTRPQRDSCLNIKGNCGKTVVFKPEANGECGKYAKITWREALVWQLLWVKSNDWNDDDQMLNYGIWLNKELFGQWKLNGCLHKCHRSPLWCKIGQLWPPRANTGAIYNKRHQCVCSELWVGGSLTTIAETNQSAPV